MKTLQLFRPSGIIMAGLLLITTISGCRNEKTDGPIFRTADPVWAAGLETEKNLTVSFSAGFKAPPSGEAFLRITGSTLYRIRLNGQFVGHGPARAGHGWYRVDEWNLSGQLTSGMNDLEIEVAGYNVNSYYLLNQPSFIQAEVVADGQVLAATSARKPDFKARLMNERVQKVPRYSFQRPFTEVYRIGGKVDASDLKGKEVTLAETEKKRLIERGVPYPGFTVRKPVAEVATGTFLSGVKRDNYWKDRSVVNIGEKLGGFKEAELELNQSIELQETEIQNIQSGSNEWTSDSGRSLEPGQFRIFDLGTNLTGFIGTRLNVSEGGRFYITFDELLTGGDVDFKRLGCISAILYDLEPGIYDLESFEPYTMRYLKVLSMDGTATVEDLFLREYANPEVDRASFESSDPRLNRIFKAAVETFRQNAVDVFMDCPHRERAGWLCDSYFTARVAYDVSGNSSVERNFFENFLLPDSFAHLPKGMLPMCYPSDHNDSVFIPNWAMWFVVELREYQNRSGDQQLIERLKPRVMDLLGYFQPFKNSDGLLEKLDSWIFVEWSAANSFVQDVNYPTNMLFAATLDAAAELYQIDSLKAEAARIRETIRKQSWNGTFFVDNAVRNPLGELVTTGNTSEVCQYFGFYFGVASPETHPLLWEKLATRFGPDRVKNGIFPSVHPANSFVGNYLRLELLSRYHLQAQLLEESIGYFDYMALQTGTLWENISSYASCNHGFASHVVHVFYRDVLGIAQMDLPNKKIILRITDLPITFCRGSLPTGPDLITLEWKRDGNTVNYRADIPDGYLLEVSGDPGLTLVREH